MNRAAWRYYLARYRPHRGTLATALVVALLQFLLVLPTVFLIRYLFDTVIPRGRLSTLVGFAVLLFALSLANGAVTLWLRRATLFLTKIIIRDIRGHLIDSLYLFSRSFFDRSDRGALHTTIVQDTERLDIMSNALIAQLLPSVIISASLGIALVTIDVRLTLALFTVLPALYFVNRKVGRLLKLRFRLFREAFEAFSKGVLFVLETLDLARIQGAERGEAARQGRALEELRARSASMAWLDTAYQLLQSNLAVIASLLVLVLGGWSVAARRITLGELLSYYVALNLLASYVRVALSAVPQIITGNESLAAIHALLTNPDRAPYNGSRSIRFQGDIRFADVHFSYGDAQILSGASFHLPAGSCVALMGANGSGKSTVAHLICAFYRPDAGEILADGIPYDELDVASLRQSLAVVMQNPTFFRGSIRENLAYGREDAPLEEIIAAAELATAHEFIELLPQGYETPIGDDGLRLSGGQRQRLAIARALLRRPSFLILDEPTNHLDAPAISRLMSALERLPRRPTILLISHHEEVLRHCDLRVTLAGGKATSSPAVRSLSPA